MQMFPKSRTGAVKLATPLMILCFVSIGGFLFWLSTFGPAEDQEMATGEDGEALNEIEFVDFATATQTHMGQEITIRNVGVTAMIGPRFFWTNITAEDLYLVFISEPALADSLDVSSQRRVDVTGSVMPLTDSLLNVWEEMGALRNVGDRAQAEFALDKGDYFEVLRFEIEETEDGADEPGSGESEPGDPSP